MFPKYYTALFNSVTDAIEALENQNYGTAKELLIRGQQTAEELYCQIGDEEEEMAAQA